MSAKAKSKLTPEQRNATLRRVLEKIRPYGFFVVCSLIVAAVSVAAQLKTCPVYEEIYASQFKKGDAQK